jgi:hypothetical protein
VCSPSTTVGHHAGNPAHATVPPAGPPRHHRRPENHVDARKTGKPTKTLPLISREILLIFLKILSNFFSHFFLFLFLFFFSFLPFSPFSFLLFFSFLPFFSFSPPPSSSRGQAVPDRDPLPLRGLPRTGAPSYGPRLADRLTGAAR